MKKILIPAMAVIALAACSKEQPQLPADTSRNIRINTSINGVESKAVTLGSGKQTEVQVLRKDNTANTAPTDFSGSPVSVTRETSGNLTFATVPTYDLNNNYAFFAAYHPKGTAGSNKATWTIDGKTDIITTSAWNAGNYAAPVTTGMTFNHQLAQLEVICKADPAAGVSEAAVQSAWGKITGIELVNTSNTAEFAYNGLGMTFSTANATLPLSGPDYSTAFSNATITKANSAVTAAGMFAPVATGTAPITLNVKSTVVTGGKTVTVQLASGGSNKGFEKGLKHTVTLTFGASTKNISATATSITPWGSGYTGSGALEN